MGSLNSPPSPPIILSVPTIDFSNSDLKPGNPKWESVKSQVKNAMEDYGCFSAIFSEDYHCDRQGFWIEIIPLMKSLFDVPEEKKIGIDRPYSYIPRRPESSSPLYESLAIGDASTFQSIEGFVNGLLPQGDHLSSSEALESFKNEAVRIQETIRRMIVESLGLEKYMEDHMRSVQYSLRMQKYEAKSGSEVGLIPHKDPNTLTILYQNKVSGLEVQTKDGNWVAVTPPPCSFIVLMAESLNAWANGRFHVPPHRVMISGSEDRYSIGLFTRPKDGYTVQIPEEMVDEEHPLAYRHFDYSEYRKVQSQHLASGKDLLDLKTYCDMMQSTA